jgi:hypothetical protein
MNFQSFVADMAAAGPHSSLYTSCDALPAVGAMSVYWTVRVVDAAWNSWRQSALPSVRRTKCISSLDNMIILVPGRADRCPYHSSASCGVSSSASPPPPAPLNPRRPPPPCAASFASSTGSSAPPAMSAPSAASAAPAAGSGSKKIDRQHPTVDALADRTSQRRHDVLSAGRCPAAAEWARVRLAQQTEQG